MKENQDGRVQMVATARFIAPEGTISPREVFFASSEERADELEQIGVAKRHSGKGNEKGDTTAQTGASSGQQPTLVTTARPERAAATMPQPTKAGAKVGGRALPPKPLGKGKR